MTEAPQSNRTGRKVITEADALAALRAHATVSIPVGGAAVGVGRERAYAAADRGDLPVIRIGGERRVVSVKLLAMLGLWPEPSSGAVPPVEGDGP